MHAFISSRPVYSQVLELQLVQNAAVLNLPLPCTFSGIPTDEEQATGLERRALQALKHGKVGYYTRKYTVLHPYKY